jgi:hypothetical protein
MTLSVPVDWKKMKPLLIPKRRILQGLKITSKSVTAADETHLQSTWKSTLFPLDICGKELVYNCCVHIVPQHPA